MSNVSSNIKNEIFYGESLVVGVTGQICQMQVRAGHRVFDGNIKVEG